MGKPSIIKMSVAPTVIYIFNVPVKHWKDFKLKLTNRSKIHRKNRLEW